MKQKVLSPKNLPAKLPITPSIVLALAIDRWHPSEWLVGILWFLMVIVWLCAINRFFWGTEEVVVWDEARDDFIKSIS